MRNAPCGSSAGFGFSEAAPARPAVRTASAPSSRRISADGRRLPEVVRRAARFVDLPERELDRHGQLHFLRVDVRHLQVEARALDLDDAGDERRRGAAREVVERERADLPDAVREPDLVELVPREALVADALARELRLAA